MLPSYIHTVQRVFQNYSSGNELLTNETSGQLSQNPSIPTVVELFPKLIKLKDGKGVHIDSEFSDRPGIEKEEYNIKKNVALNCTVCKLSQLVLGNAKILSMKIEGNTILCDVFIIG